MPHIRLAVVFAFLALPSIAAPAFAAGPSFKPDARFEGSTLDEWQPLGAADWRAEAGEIVGTPRQPDGGWLIFNRSYQDTGVFATFRCAAGCSTGVLLRAERLPDGGLKGIYVSLSEGDVAPYAVTLDPQGRVTTRTRLRAPTGGQVRIAPPPPADTQGPGRAGGPPAGPGRGGRGAAPAVTLPIAPPSTGLHPGEWNDVEILLDANIVRTFINNAGPSGVADEEMGRFGPFALHVAGGGEVRFRNIAYKDLALRVRAAEATSPRFRVQQLSDFYYSFGASAADFDGDGTTDVVAGPHIYFGPEYTTSREIYLATTVNPSTQFASDAWMQFAADFTGDGRPDVLNASFSGANSGATLYVNPGAESRRWDSYRVTTSQQTEIAVVDDVDDDGRLDLVYGAQGAMHYASPDPARPTEPWTVHTVSETGYATAHGVGVGDINGDGRKDILNAYGWWEQPVEPTAGPWRYHSQAFGRAIGRASAGGSVMAVYDANGDGLNDVVTSLSAHGWGLAWYEQQRDASGAISFVQHMIMDDHNTPDNAGGVAFSQLHGTTIADVDGDGIRDFIVGKRYWSHQDTQIDPDPYGAPVIYWYRTVRSPGAPGGAEFQPELIHNQSGVGSDAWAGDINGDGRVDIVTSTKFGTFVFWGQAPR